MYNLYEYTFYHFICFSIHLFTAIYFQPCLPACNCGKKEPSFFPKLSQKCHRGDYVQDNKNLKAESDCQKKMLGHPVLAPGIFTMSCTHGNNSYKIYFCWTINIYCVFFTIGTSNLLLNIFNLIICLLLIAPAKEFVESTCLSVCLFDHLYKWNLVSSNVSQISVHTTSRLNVLV